MKNRITAAIVTIVLGACSLGRMQTISDSKFRALYPSGYATVAELQAKKDEANTRVQDAESALRGARALRAALTARFELLEPALEHADRLGQAALLERWPGSVMTDVAACTELKGALSYVAAQADTSARALVDWRTAILMEAERYAAVWQAEIELEKIEPYFALMSASEKENPDVVRAHWEQERTAAISKWQAAITERKNREAAFRKAAAEFESYRAALPRDSTCPVFLKRDPLFEPVIWDNRTVTVPEVVRAQ